MENEIVRKDETKGKIILFVIGVLFGAVITSAAFLICVNTLGSNNNGNSSMQMPGGTPPEMPSGESSQSGQNQPPEMPSGESSQSGQNQSSEMPSNNNQNSDNQ